MRQCLQDFSKHLVPSCFDVYYTQATSVAYNPYSSHSYKNALWKHGTEDRIKCCIFLTALY